MTVQEKLALMQQVKERNEARIRAHIGESYDVKSLANAIEIHARAIDESLEILSEHYNVPKVSLLDQLVNTLQAMMQPAND